MLFGVRSRLGRLPPWCVCCDDGRRVRTRRGLRDHLGLAPCSADEQVDSGATARQTMCDWHPVRDAGFLASPGNHRVLSVLSGLPPVAHRVCLAPWNLWRPLFLPSTSGPRGGQGSGWLGQLWSCSCSFPISRVSPEGHREV